MTEKTLRTRIALLYKSYEEWITAEYTPLRGEVCFCEIPEGARQVASEPCLLFKVGDGTKTFAELPWCSALAADIFAWAKKENLEFIDLTQEFKDKLVEYLEPRLLHKDTLYKLVEVSANKWQLMKSEDKGESWVEAEGTIDLSETIKAIEESILAISSKSEELQIEINKVADDLEITTDQLNTKINQVEAESIIKIEQETARAEEKETELAEKIDTLHIAEYEIKKLEDAGEYAARYILAKDGIQAGIEIDIAKDQVLKHVEIRTAGKGDISGFPEGTKYIDFEWSTGTHSYVSLQDLVDIYLPGEGIDISQKNVISIKSEVLNRIATLETAVVDINAALVAETNRALEAEFNKVDKQVLSEDNVSSIINSINTTGIKFENETAISFIGIDGEVSDKYVVLYNNSTDKEVKIGLTKDGAYYTVNKAIFTSDDELVTKKDIKNISGAMHYRGVFESLDDVIDPKPGDVAVVNLIEYIYNGTTWDSIGEEGIWATKVALDNEIQRASTAESELLQTIVQEASLRQEKDTELENSIVTKVNSIIDNSFGYKNIIINENDSINIAILDTENTGSGILGQHKKFYYWKDNKTEITDENELATLGDISEYSLVKDNNDIYHLTKDGEYVGAEINIAKSQVLKEASVKVCIEKDKPIEGLLPGDKYIDFEWANGTHSYLAISDLVVVYKAGTGITISSDNTISIDATYIDSKLQSIILDIEDFGFNSDLKVEQEVEGSSLVDTVLEVNLKAKTLLKVNNNYLEVIETHYNLDGISRGFVCYGGFIKENEPLNKVYPETFIFNYNNEVNITTNYYLDIQKALNDLDDRYAFYIAEINNELAERVHIDSYKALVKKVDIIENTNINFANLDSNVVYIGNNYLTKDYNVAINHNQNDLRLFIKPSAYKDVPHQEGQDTLVGKLKAIPTNQVAKFYQVKYLDTGEITEVLPIKSYDSPWSYIDTQIYYGDIEFIVAEWDSINNRWESISSKSTRNKYFTRSIEISFFDAPDGLLFKSTKYISFVDNWEDFNNSKDWATVENELPEIDNKSIEISGNTLELKDYEKAFIGQMPIKDIDSGLKWVNPVSQAEVDNIEATIDELIDASNTNEAHIDILNQVVKARIELSTGFEEFKIRDISQNDLRVLIPKDAFNSIPHEEGIDILFGEIKVYYLDALQPHYAKIGEYEHYVEDFYTKQPSVLEEDESGKKYAKFNIPIATWNSEQQVWTAKSALVGDHYYPSYGILVEWYNRLDDDNFEIVDTFSKRISISDFDHFYNNKDWYSVEPAYVKVDTNSIVQDNSFGLAIHGFRDARQGQVLAKDTQHGDALTWIDPLSPAELQRYVDAAYSSAVDAGNKAVAAGNSAIEAHQSELKAAAEAEKIKGLIWRGSIDEYNALEEIDPEVIYIIVA